MVTIEDLKNNIESLGYYATEELVYDTYNALCMYKDGIVNEGQDIYAICLEGPPGAGKTLFAKTYTKLAGIICNSDVEMVDYQCDATTGKAELFEDLNISAAIRRDADNVNVPGKLVEAINKVNEGKKVVLFIDEYDKAREETDAFFLQLLQDGKVNSIQHGDLTVKNEYKSNLQVILCKNDMREELSGPLSRRIRIIRLDYMEPSTFYNVAKRTLIDEREDKVNDGLLNLVVLMYKSAYEKKDIYNRLPSCSEMLIALEDADRLMKRANAPQHIIYKTIIKNMFKSLDDITTFESSLSNIGDERNLKKLIDEMKKSETKSNEIDINSLIAEKVFKNESQKLIEKTLEMQNLINEYKEKFSNMEKRRQELIETEIEKILLENGKLVSSTNIPNTITNFEDESKHIKRGYDIFKLSKEDWIEVGEIVAPALSHHNFIDKLIENINAFDIKIYENGILIKEDGDQKLIVVNVLDENNNSKYKVMSNYPVIPSIFINDINNFIKAAKETISSQPKTATQIADKYDNLPFGNYNINALIYNDTELNNNHFIKTQDNVYNMTFSSNIDITKTNTNLDDFIKLFVCKDTNKIISLSKDIMSAKRKVLKNE